MFCLCGVERWVFGSFSWGVDGKVEIESLQMCIGGGVVAITVFLPTPGFNRVWLLKVALAPLPLARTIDWRHVIAFIEFQRGGSCERASLVWDLSSIVCSCIPFCISHLLSNFSSMNSRR